MRRKIFLIPLLMLFVLLVLFSNCKSPVTPDEPNQYRDEVLVTYTRDPAWIVFPAGGDSATYGAYELFDPDTDRPLTELEYIEENFRIGTCDDMEKIAENKFQCHLKHVLVQRTENQPSHSIHIHDVKLYDGVNPGSVYTPYGITIEGAYDLEIKGYKLFFRMH